MLMNWTSKVAGMTRRAPEVSAAVDGGLIAQTHGLLAGTRVASNLGWRAVDKIAVGDEVLTFDNAMQRVAEVHRSVIWPQARATPAQLWPVVVPQGAMGNRCEITLLPDQGVMVDCDAAQDMQGDPFAVVPAQALEGLHGIHRQPVETPVELITLFFQSEEVIYAEGGLLVHCPRTFVSLDDMLAPATPVYDVLTGRDAAFLVDCLDMEAQIVASGGYQAAQANAAC